MSKIIDLKIWQDQRVDGYVLKYLLCDPKVIRDELKISNLQHIDYILSFVKKMKD